MDLIEIIFLAGAHCVSPLQTADGMTEVNKVACAVMVRQDQHTAAIQIVPDHSATDPQVIALLGRSIAIARPRPFAAEIRPTSATLEQIPVLLPQDASLPSKPLKKASAVPVAKVKMAKRQKSRETVGLTVNRKKTTVRKRTDQCGSYRAVWYTNKEGRRKYRCVRG